MSRQGMVYASRVCMNHWKQHLTGDEQFYSRVLLYLRCQSYHNANLLLSASITEWIQGKITITILNIIAAESIAAV